MRLTIDTMRAWSLDARLKTCLTIPTDLDAIADMLEITIIESRELPGDSLGMHLVHPEDSRAIVAVKPGLSHGCRRFTVGHEICHHLIARAERARGKTASLSQARIDRLCNQYAAELLMPRPEVELYAPHYTYGLQPQQLQDLCDLFEVTAGAMELRLKELRIPSWWWDERESIEAISVERSRG